MFEAKSEVTEARERLWELSLSYQKGSRIDFSEIERATGIQRYTGSWLYVIRSWKERMFRERDIVVYAYGGEAAGAYSLLTDRQVATDYAEHQQKRGRRRIRRTLKRVRRTDDANLSDHERRIKVCLIDGLRRESAQITAVLKVGKVKRTQVNPTRKWLGYPPPPLK